MSLRGQAVTLLAVLALLVIAELVAFDQVSSEKTNAMECWPDCTFYEDLIRNLALLLLPLAIIGVAIAVLIVAIQALVAALRRSRR